MMNSASNNNPRKYVGSRRRLGGGPGGRPTINNDGRIIRSSSSSKVSYSRIGIVVVILSILIISNPGNNESFNEIKSLCNKYFVTFSSSSSSSSKSSRGSKSKDRYNNNNKPPPPLHDNEDDDEDHFDGNNDDDKNTNKDEDDIFSWFIGKAIDYVNELDKTNAFNFKKKFGGNNSRGITNYLIFSLQNRYGVGIKILGLSQKIQICSVLADYEPYERKTTAGKIHYDTCEWINKNWCHEKPLLYDKSDKAYTTYRILCFIYIILSILSYCGIYLLDDIKRRSIININNNNGSSSLSNAFIKTIIDAMISVLYPSNNNVLWDLFELNFYIYPSLVTMNGLVYAYSKLGGEQTFYNNYNTNYVISVILFIFGIGGISNILATKLSNRSSSSNSYYSSSSSSHSQYKIIGIRSLSAASLGYLQAVVTSSSSINIKVIGMKVTTANIFWTNLVLIIVTSNHIGSAISWMIGGMIGNMYGQYHLNRLNIWDMMLHKLFK